MSEIIKYINTPDIVQDVCGIIDSAQNAAYRSVNTVLVLRNWLLGKRISEEELNGADRAAAKENRDTLKIGRKAIIRAIKY